MNKLNCLKGFFSNSSYFIYLNSLLRIPLFRVCVKEVVVCTFLVLCLILVHIIDPKKVKLVDLCLFFIEVSLISLSNSPFFTSAKSCRSESCNS